MLFSFLSNVTVMQCASTPTSAVFHGLLQSVVQFDTTKISYPKIKTKNLNVPSRDIAPRLVTVHLVVEILYSIQL